MRVRVCTGLIAEIIKEFSLITTNSGGISINKKHGYYAVLIATVLLVTAGCDLTGVTAGDGETPVVIVDDAITSFALDSAGAGVELDGNNIAVTVPTYTDVTALAVEFSITGTSIHVGGVEQVSGVTTNDYTNPITFTLTASDGTTRDYTVTVQEGGRATLSDPGFVGGTFSTLRAFLYSRGYHYGETDSPIVDLGIVYNTTGYPDIGDNIQSIVSGDVDSFFFEGDVAPFSENTVYHVRSFVTTAEGTVYSPERIFNSGYAIGASHAGGLVYHNDGSGGGMVAATVDQHTGPGSPWIAGGSTTTTYNPGAISDIDGLANSLAIVAQAGHTSSAAQLALDYSVDSYSDWYLPAKNELVHMMYNLTQYGLSTDFVGSYYWSSTGDRTALYGDQYAWEVYGTATGVPPSDYWGKTATFKVRAIRSF